MKEIPGTVFWVIEYLGKDGNMVAYLKDIDQTEHAFVLTKDIHEALSFDSQQNGQLLMDDQAFLLYAGSMIDSFKVREHQWMGEVV